MGTGRFQQAVWANQVPVASEPPELEWLWVVKPGACSNSLLILLDLFVWSWNGLKKSENAL